MSEIIDVKNISLDEAQQLVFHFQFKGDPRYDAKTIGRFFEGIHSFNQRRIPNSTLLVKSVRYGSELELYSFIKDTIAPLSGVAVDLGIFNYFRDLKSMFDLWRSEVPTKQVAKQYNIENKDIETVQGVIGPATFQNSDGGTMNIHFGDKIVKGFTEDIDQETAKRIYKNAGATKAVLKETESEYYPDEEFRFTRIGKQLKTGRHDRIIVPEVSSAELKVKYSSSAVKEEILHISNNHFNVSFKGDVTIEFDEDEATTAHVERINSYA